jgi:serine/threonine protein kinase
MKYQRTSIKNPTLLILAIDVSLSMASAFRLIDGKRLNYVEIGAKVIEGLLYEVILLSHSGMAIRNNYICTVIGYKIQNGKLQLKSLLEPSYTSELPNRIVGISDTIEKVSSIWIDDTQKISTAPEISLSSLVSFVEKWAEQNINSLPPVVINLVDSSSSVSINAFKQLQNIKTKDGTSLIFNCFIENLPVTKNSLVNLQDFLKFSSILPRKLPLPKESTEKVATVPLKAGTRIGNYTITEKIGEGGVGQVYKAHHNLLNQAVAIKVLEQFPNDPVISTAFLQAANYLSQLNHPNIVGLFDYGLLQKKAYMVMEFVEGITLDKLIPKTPSEVWTKRTIFIFTQLLSALRYAHSCIYRNVGGAQVQGIIHGDIKPANILVNLESDVIKLTDFMIPDIQQYLTRDNFELRKLLSPLGIPFTNAEKQIIIDRIMPISTAMFGTPKYMPPEQWDGKVSIRADIFCLGATLYELVTGLPPMSLFKGIHPRHINPFIPEWIEQFIVKSMKIEPSERYNSIAEIESFFLDNLKESNKFSFYVKEFVMGDKIEFNNTGTVNNHGQLFMGKFNDVYANLNIAGQLELAEALKTLKDAIMASKEITEAQKQEGIEVVNKIGDEVIKQNPNKTFIKGLSEGLLSTLKHIPDIAKAIAAIAPFIAEI